MNMSEFVAYPLFNLTVYLWDYGERYDDIRNTSELVLLTTSITVACGKMMSLFAANLWQQTCQSEIPSLKLDKTCHFRQSTSDRSNKSDSSIYYSLYYIEPIIGLHFFVLHAENPLIVCS